MAIAALGVALVLVAGIVARQLAGLAPSASAPLGMPAPVVPSAAAAAPPTLQRFVFEADSDRLPSGSTDRLTAFADAARAGGAPVEISGYYPSGGDTAGNVDLAKRRVLAVRHALEADGVAPAQMRSGVALAPAGGPAGGAGWVEFVLR